MGHMWQWEWPTAGVSTRPCPEGTSRTRSVVRGHLPHPQVTPPLGGERHRSPATIAPPPGAWRSGGCHDSI
jgi:hypothetical protein